MLAFIQCPFHSHVTAVAHKRPRSFCQKCWWQVTLKQAYNFDPSKSVWAVYATVQAECGNLSGNERTHTSSWELLVTVKARLFQEPRNWPARRKECYSTRCLPHATSILFRFRPYLCSLFLLVYVRLRHVPGIILHCYKNLAEKSDFLNELHTVLY